MKPLRLVQKMVEDNAVLRPIKLSRLSAFRRKFNSFAECDKVTGEIPCLWFVRIMAKPGFGASGRRGSPNFSQSTLSP